MARVICKCGNILRNQEVPNDVELRVYTDREWDKILDCDVIETWKVPLPKYDVWKCPKCKRIYVFEPGNNEATYVYSLEKR